MTARLRVLLLTPWYPTIGDAVTGSFVHDFVRAMGRRHDVVVVHMDARRDASAEGGRPVPEAAPVVRVVQRTVPPPLSHAVVGAGGLRAIRRLHRELGPFDLVHAHVFSAGVVGALYARRANLPLVITEHSSSLAASRPARARLAAARFAFARAERVLPVSKALRAALERHVVARFEVIPNPVDPELFHPETPGSRDAGEAFRILFVGHLIPVKGLDVLLEALAVVGSDPRWTATIVGDGVLRPALERRSRELGLASRVTFAGVRARGEVASLMRQHDVLVLPSRWESLPTVVVEALMSGTPVIATDVGGVSEIAPPPALTLITPDDPSALAGSLGAAMSSERPDASIVAASVAETYSFDAVADRVDAVYESVLGGRRER